jgi:hypothetical protein
MRPRKRDNNFDSQMQFMTLNNSHANGTISASMASDNNDYVAAVGARLQKTDVDLQTSVCRGYTGYWCYVKTGYTTKGKELDVSLEMKKCGDTSMTSLTQGDFTDSDADLDTSTWYDLQFQMVGSHLACKLVKYGSRNTDDALASIEVADYDYSEVRPRRTPLLVAFHRCVLL